MAMRGAAEHIARLKRLTSPEATRQIGAALYAGADRIKAKAQYLITEGSVSGKNHVPSNPGEPPNNDTGVLKNNIEAVLKEPLVAEISSNAPYAAPLEFGSSKMAARPYMVPARDAERAAVQELVTQAVNHVVKG
ncbi:MAG: HK97 gp10 family phage protein [Pseudomonadota bacterium]